MWDLTSPTMDWTHTACIGRNLNHWTARKVLRFLIWFLFSKGACSFTKERRLEMKTLTKKAAISMEKNSCCPAAKLCLTLCTPSEWPRAGPCRDLSVPRTHIRLGVPSLLIGKSAFPFGNLGLMLHSPVSRWSETDASSRKHALNTETSSDHGCTVLF